MATGPINYAVGMPDLTSQFSNFNVALSGYMDRDKAIRDGAEKKAKEEAFASRLKEILASGDQRALLDLQIENPEKFEFARGAWNQLKDDEKKAQFGQLQDVATLLNTSPDLGVQKIDEAVVAMENSGQDASKFKALRDLAVNDPKAASLSLAMIMGAVDPEKTKAMYDLVDSRAKAERDAAQEGRTSELHQYTVAGKKFDQEMQQKYGETAEQLALRQKAAATEGTLLNTELSAAQEVRAQAEFEREQAEATQEAASGGPEFAKITPTLQKLLDKESNARITAETSARQFDEIITRARAIESRYKGATWGGAASMARKAGEYVGLFPESDLAVYVSKVKAAVNKEALANLPQGPATDKDVQLVLDASINPNSPPETIVRYFEAASRLQRDISTSHETREEFVQKTGLTGGVAPRDIVIGGVAYPKGTGLKKIVDDQVAVKRGGASSFQAPSTQAQPSGSITPSSTAAPASKGYMKYATPQRS